MFHDRARIYVSAGRGGDGALSFRREKHVPKGGPDGGDGGPGGNVLLVADPDLRDLSKFQTGREYRAARGEPGRGSNRHGAAGKTAELRVPVGTQVSYGGSRMRVRRSPSTRSRLWNQSWERSRCPTAASSPWPTSPA